MSAGLPELVQRLTNDLCAGVYECMVCSEPVAHKDRLWSCRSCSGVFHLACIAHWEATRRTEREKQLRSTSTYRDDDAALAGKFRCPLCQALCDQAALRRYVCYCGKMQDPPVDAMLAPGSCGSTCERRRADPNCPHRCALMCHPGPCPPCSLFRPQPCYCGQHSRAVGCSSEVYGYECGQTCGKALDCGNHTCTAPCHEGDCPVCVVAVKDRCYCGAMGRERRCAEAAGFRCQRRCTKLRDCGNHTCGLVCHPDGCEPCLWLPGRQKFCPCGKTRVTAVRASCLDPVPSCGLPCELPLLCGHLCHYDCHDEADKPCAPCKKTVAEACACGGKHFTFPCFCSYLPQDEWPAAAEAAGVDPIALPPQWPPRCAKACRKLFSCRKHKCAQSCCTDTDHSCFQICTRKLSCGLHQCGQLCHSGDCPPCATAAYERLFCRCRRSWVDPPVPCGTKPPRCNHPCVVPRPCGHPPNHPCHIEPDCPPCAVPVEKKCASHAAVMPFHMPCHLADVSCGRRCVRALKCCGTACELICHSGACVHKCKKTYPSFADMAKRSLMYVGKTGNIFIEKEHPAYPHVADFLVSCCEPVSRTQRMEQYCIDSSSLSAASAEGTYSTDMIRNILRYFRQDERNGVAAPADGNGGNGGDGMALDLRRLAALEAWAASREADADSGSYHRCLAQLEMSPAVAAESSTAAFAQCAPSSPPVLSFPLSPAPQQLAPGAPLVSLAVRPGLPPLAPLPAAIEALLAEEEAASKVRIVLQPRLRRFGQQQQQQQQAAGGVGGAVNGLLTRGGAHHRNNTSSSISGGADGEELCYFVVSPDRRQLERVVESAAREFLEPVLLHGAVRWVVSDLDRGVEDALAAAESGRPAYLRRLYASGACAATAKGVSSSSATAAAAAAVDTGMSRLVYKTQVRPGRLRNLRECLFHTFGIRADCFYDHLQDRTMHVDNLSLASSVRLRPYQTASLERFQRGNKAHQGVIVLPCGAGKTLTGIGAAAIMKKRTIVMCVNSMSVFQWQREFLRWTNLTEAEVTMCTNKVKQMPGKVFITTYSMLVSKRGVAKGVVAQASEEILKAVKDQTWGLLLLDEVHTALAQNFQEVLNRLQYKCVLGLSATLLREDDRIPDLRHLVGPKLYEANWLDLTRAGFLARVECAEVQCPMPAAFFVQYAAATDSSQDATTTAATSRSKRQSYEDEGYEDADEDDNDDDGSGGGPAGRKCGRRTGRRITVLAHNMAASNPNKLWATQALLEFHRNRSPPDKVIVFCDYLADVRFYAYHLHLPFMDRATSETERTNLLRYFQFSDTINAIILTRVGDVALDLPCASVVIQISGLGASRRQEAQRLGRILRPKPPSLDNTCSYFYTLVSQDTHEVRAGYNRQSWLRDQGFAYRVLRCSQVLAEFARVGGQPCCIGAPQWWYQVPPGSAHNINNTDSSVGGDASRPVAHGGGWWVPFSAAASARIQYNFNRGRPECLLEAAAHLGPSTVRPAAAELGGLAVGAQERWTVRFSSADSPNSFGTVIIGEAPLRGNAGSHSDSNRVRRITLGEFRRPHDCLAEGGACLAHALEGLGATVDDDHRDIHGE